ncbi:MAG: DoxX family protein [Fibrobacteres bacterium]|jgi:hypothetical protein|nr:DoxX family protein [Fibrobacterota bacterium]
MSSASGKVLYWVSTVLISGNWIFGSIAALLRTDSSMEVFRRLGYPDYFALLLGLAQLLGVIAILAPVPRTLREWAYAGLTMDVIAAVFSLIAIGTPAFQIAIPLVALALVLVSYRGWKLRLRTKAT